MEELSPIRETIPRLEAGEKASDFSVDPHSLTQNLKSGGVSKPNDVVSDRRRPSPRTTEEMKVLQRGVTKGKTSKRSVVVQGQDLGREPVLGLNLKSSTPLKERKTGVRNYEKKSWHGIRFSPGHLT